VADAVAGEARLEILCGELGTLVGDRVAGRAEATDGHGEEANDVGRAWFGEEDPGDEGAAGEDVEAATEASPADPARGRCWTTGRTRSAKRRTGGSGLRREPTVSLSGWA
jgi:hypothetical protein